MSLVFGADAYAPQEIAARVRDVGVAKARLPWPTQALLGVLAGAFIGLGALVFTLVASDASLSFAASRLLGGLAFSLGLVLVTVAGAELFTGNNLIAMAWASGQVGSLALLRNWALVCSANLVGAVGLALLAWLSGQGGLNQGDVGRAAVRIALAKAELPWGEAFFRGVLCNVLVCMAVWMAMAGRSVTDKAVAIVFPITAFVAAGFEHSIANLYFFPLAMLLGAPLAGADMVRNLVSVIAGNLVGGSVLVALVYWLVYLRADPLRGWRCDSAPPPAPTADVALVHTAPGQAVDVQPLGARLAGAQNVALFKSADLEVTRLVLHAGKSLPSHKVAGEITVQCIEGALDVTADGRSHVLRAGQLLYLSGDVVHAVTALEDASALLTVALRK
jgi:formate transporter